MRDKREKFDVSVSGIEAPSGMIWILVTLMILAFVDVDTDDRSLHAAVVCFLQPGWCETKEGSG